MTKVKIAELNVKVEDIFHLVKAESTQWYIGPESILKSHLIYFYLRVIWPIFLDEKLFSKKKKSSNHAWINFKMRFQKIFYPIMDGLACKWVAHGGRFCHVVGSTFFFTKIKYSHEGFRLMEMVHFGSFVNFPPIQKC